MRQSMALEEGHEGGGKGGESVIKRHECWLSTHGISKEHHHKINHLIGAESRACKTHLFLDAGEQTRLREELCHHRHLSEPGGKGGNGLGRDLDVDRCLCHTTCVSSLW